MKKLYSPLFILLCFTLIVAHYAARALSGWITYHVDSHLSVQLPSQPVEKDWKQFFANKGTILSAEQIDQLKATRIFGATDGVANYGITVANGIFSKPPSKHERTYFYNGAIKGLLLKEHGTLLQRSTFTVNGHEGVEISYIGHKTTGEMVVKHQRALILDEAQYVLTVTPVGKSDSTGISVKEQRTKFFNSIAYQPSPKSSK
jgi:hypothetical protein